MIPRVRGKVGTVMEPPEVKGKWAFELWLTELGGGETTEEDSLGVWGPYDTEEEAHQKLKETAKEVVEICEKRLSGEISGRYIDMKSNKSRRFDLADEN